MKLIAYLWRYRWHIILPLLLGPALLLLISAGQPPQFSARTTLHLDPELAQTPLLKDLQANPDHVAILKRTLHSPAVLDDTLKQSGQLLAGLPATEASRLRQHFSQNLQLNVVGKNLVEIIYASNDPLVAEDILTTVSFNFIYELLTPTRFRLDQQLLALEQQIKAYGTREKAAAATVKKLQAEDNPEDLTSLVAAEFEQQRVSAQRELAQAEYDQLLASKQNLNFGFDSTNPSSVMWFVEPPQLIAQDFISNTRDIGLLGLGLGALFSLLIIFWSRWTDNTLRTPEQVQKYVGLPVLGQLPNLGPVALSRGNLTIDLTEQLKTVEPAAEPAK